MSDRVKVLLISQPTLITTASPDLRLAYIGASLEKIGCEVKAIDTAARYNRLTTKQILTQVKSSLPDFLIIVCHIAEHIKFAYELSKYIKQKLKQSLIVGIGLHSTTCPDELLRNSFDIAVRGEAEYTIRDIVDFIKKEKELEDIEGISFIREGKVFHNPNRPLIQDLDSLPFPARHLFDLKWYVRDGDIYRAHINAMRGCAERCTFCESHLYTGWKLRIRSAENIYNEMNLLNSQYGCKYFFFSEGTFTINRKTVTRLCDLISYNKEFFPQWECGTRVDCVDRELLSKMKEAGCRAVIFGLESGDEEMLKIMNKNITLEQIENAVNWTTEVGLKCEAEFVCGFPEETSAQVYRTIKLIKRLSSKLSAFNVNTLVPRRGATIYEKNKKKYGFENWWLKEEFTKGSINSPFYQAMALGNVTLYDFALDKDFFKYSIDMKRALKKIQKYKINFLLRKQKSFKTMVFIFFYIFSYYLNKVSPSIERLIMKKCYFTSRKIYRLFRDIF